MMADSSVKEISDLKKTEKLKKKKKCSDSSLTRDIIHPLNPG